MTVNQPRVSKSTFGQVVDTLVRLALPATCCLCEAPGSKDFRGNALDLCSICFEMLPINRHLCVRCAVPVAHKAFLCPDCRAEPPPFDRALAPYLYAYPVEHLIRGLKFRGERAYGRLLGQLLAAAHARQRAQRPDVLVPIPLHADRYRARGYNQALEIARTSASTLGIALAPNALVRTAATAEQSGLPLAERRRNVRGAFAVRELPRARRVALVDDVMTTGSTAAEAARVLKAAGSAHVEIWAVARVPLERSDAGAPTSGAH